MYRASEIFMNREEYEELTKNPLENHLDKLQTVNQANHAEKQLDNSEEVKAKE
jgi:hypothetical protein